MAKRTWKILLTLLFLYSVLAASNVAAQKKVVTLLSAGTSKVESEYQDFTAKEWNKANPNIELKVEYVSWEDLGTKIQAYTAAQTPPDLFWSGLWFTQDFADMGLVEPLDKWLKDDKAKYQPSIFNEPGNCMYKGQWVMAPFCVVYDLMVVRTDLAKGIDPKSIVTWDDLIAAVKKVHNPPNVYGFGYALSETWVTTGRLHDFLISNGVQSLVDFRPEKETAYRQTLKTISTLFQYSPPSIPTWMHGDEISAFVQNTQAISIQGTYYPGDFLPERPDLGPKQITLIPMPHGPQMKSNTIRPYYVGYCMAAASNNKPEAAKVLSWLNNDRNAALFPMNASTRKTPPDYKARILNESGMYGGKYGDKVGWWYGASAAAAEKFKVIGEARYTPGAEIDKVALDVMIKLFNKEVSSDEAYDQLKTRIQALMK